MADFKYVKNADIQNNKIQVIDLIQKVQNDLKSVLKFDFRFVGSVSRNRNKDKTARRLSSSRFCRSN